MREQIIFLFQSNNEDKKQTFIFKKIILISVLNNRFFCKKTKRKKLSIKHENFCLSIEKSVLLISEIKIFVNFSLKMRNDILVLQRQYIIKNNNFTKKKKSCQPEM